MDRFSFLNAAHTAFFADLYDQYIENPDSVEPSWRSFFQGFDFGMQGNGYETLDVEQPRPAAQPVSDYSGIPEKLQKEFKVLNLIEGYRTRGHLFTKTNPVRDRRIFTPNLSLETFGLSDADLDTTFDAAKEAGLQQATLRQIVDHLRKVYCQHIGIEYMYIRDPEIRKWIQNRLTRNDNQPDFSADQKKGILSKLNEAVSFENFLHTKYVGQKRFSLEGGESLLPA
ncbi:2-oxoglutarate dehydrogenase E1 subunit family protein, partial [Flavobacterium sp.]|uniref:2-oxoglutarate dehydrogenase E1 subunit family protein n=1 Tax=Flavobacterium sp. TaxID=239 RepID=UPI0040343919